MKPRKKYSKREEDFIESFAKEIFAAGTFPAVPVDLPHKRFAGFHLGHAIAIVRRVEDLRVMCGNPIVGYKMAWTSVVMKASISQAFPAWAPIFAEHVVKEEFDPAPMYMPRVEAELVWRPGEKITEPMSAKEIEELGGEWALGIEIPSPRYHTMDFSFADSIADTLAAAVCRVGEYSPRKSRLMIDNTGVRISDGVVSFFGMGADAMGSPYFALEWFLVQLKRLDRVLLPDDFVMTGSLVPPLTVVPGLTYTVSSKGFMPVTLRAKEISDEF